MFYVLIVCVVGLHTRTSCNDKTFTQGDVVKRGCRSINTLCDMWWLTVGY